MTLVREQSDINLIRIIKSHNIYSTIFGKIHAINALIPEKPRYIVCTKIFTLLQINCLLTCPKQVIVAT